MISIHFETSPNYNKIKLIFDILDSEWSDECIYFIMIYIFFVSVITVWDSKCKSAWIFFNSILFDGKVNLVGVFARSKYDVSLI